MNFGYTQREWNFLIRHHEWEWPHEWPQMRKDIAYWRSVVERICGEHRLPFDSEMKMMNASNAAFLMDEVVIKIFARPSPIWFPREIEALRILESRPEAKSPRLIAHGTIMYNTTKHSYIIMERMPGEPYRNHRDAMSEEERYDIVRQLAGIISAIHETPTDGLQTFGLTSEEWVERMKDRADVCLEFFKDEISHHLLEQIPEFLTENLPAITNEFQPCLLHADLNSGNILVERRDNEWQITGLIDYGDVEVGPIEYEWVSTCHKPLLSNEKLVRTFFEAYNWPLPIAEPTRRQLKAYSLLHRFPMLPFIAEDHPEITSLDALVDSLWPV